MASLCLMISLGRAILEHAMKEEMLDVTKSLHLVQNFVVVSGKGISCDILDQRVHIGNREWIKEAAGFEIPEHVENKIQSYETSAQTVGM